MIQGPTKIGGSIGTTSSSTLSAGDFILADDATKTVTGVGIITLLDITNGNAAASFFIGGGGNTVGIFSDPVTKAAIADTDGKICCISAGGGNYTLKNRLGGTVTFAITMTGSVSI
jgi:hypothetical protein